MLIEMPDTTRDSAPDTSREMVARRGIRLRGRTVRQHAARGTIVNAGFSIALAVITLLRGVVIARFLTRADYGVWGILVASVATLFSLKQVGVADKYIQQEGEDQQLAFQHAFSVECVVNGAFVIFLVAAVPAIAALYGRSQLILPGLSLVLLLPAYTLQAPVWIFYRQMRFAEQRLIQAMDPVIGTVIAIVLAVVGLGYWSLIIGVIAGGWAAALLAVRASPYQLRFRINRRVLRGYLSFSWPLFVVSLSALVLTQVSLFFGTEVTGLVGAGAITLAANVSQFAERADEIVSGTMYPLICAVQHRIDLLYESFVKSNRVALVWAMPFGLGLSLFASALVRYGLGERWHAAIPLLVAFGITAAVGQLGFNWDDYFRAIGNTRPMAWTAAITAMSFLAAVIPFIYLWGLTGFAIAIGIQTLVNVGCRMFYLRRLFDGFAVLRHAARAAAPTLPAVAVVLIIRAIRPGTTHGGEILAQLLLYALLVSGATWILERGLLLEMREYLRRHSSQMAEGQSRLEQTLSAETLSTPLGI
jgi:O-antigen/teichoic acid export membrane protein